MNNTARILTCCLLLVIGQTHQAQIKSYGRTIIEMNGDMQVFKDWSFRTLAFNSSSGILGTERRLTKSYISFMPGSSWSGVHDQAYVDGYVRTYLSTKFVFPIGDNNQFKPAAVDKASMSSPAEAAYYAVNPGIAITSPFVGKISALLPPDGPFPSSKKQSVLYQVSNKEYWDVNGNMLTKLTLSWNDKSDIRRLTNGGLKNLTIAGWNGNEWEMIPSKVDAFSIFGVSSNISQGSITTTEEIDLNAYSVFTLGGLYPDKFQYFFTKNGKKQVKHLQTSAVKFDADIDMTKNPDFDITLHHSEPKYGTLINIDGEGYSYQASNFHIGVDTIRTIAVIFNKPTFVLSFDTFYNEVLVRYHQKDTQLSMNRLPTLIVGKSLQIGKEVQVLNQATSQKGYLQELGLGLYEYASKQKDATDTVLLIVNSNYNTLGVQTIDTTRYFIKLNEKFKGESIQTLITPNGDGQNDVWILPISMIEEFPNMEIKVVGLDGKIVYKNNGVYSNDFSGQGLSTGIYLYEIFLDANTILNGMLKIENQ